MEGGYVAALAEGDSLKQRGHGASFYNAEVMVAMKLGQPNSNPIMTTMTSPFPIPTPRSLAP
jgi:hypothetical protein